MNITLPPGFGAGALRTLRKSQRARARPLRRKLRSDDPVADLRDAAAELGYDGDTGDLTAMARWVWLETGDDGTADLLDELVAAGLIASPFY